MHIEWGAELLLRPVYVEYVPDTRLGFGQRGIYQSCAWSTSAVYSDKYATEILKHLSHRISLSSIPRCAENMRHI